MLGTVDYSVKIKELSDSGMNANLIAAHLMISKHDVDVVLAGGEVPESLAKKKEGAAAGRKRKKK